MNYISERFKIAAEGQADSESTVSCSRARFTILTPALIRMEWMENGLFEDRPSLNFWFRKTEKPHFTTDKKGEGVVITTELLTLEYKGGSFDAENLTIKSNDGMFVYKYGDSDPQNEGGTYRTLDGANGASFKLDPGLISKSGWSVIDDSNTPIINEDGWFECRYEKDNPTAETSIDCYFFGYGKAYRECLKAFCGVTGKTPMFPRYVLGNWWSRYYNYTQEELRGLMQDFMDKKFPLSVCIIDMDWHVIHNDYHNGWTGYTWNENYFPDYREFLDWLHENGMRTALNLHPAGGVAPHEVQYEKMAEHMGIDPASKEVVPFDITDPKYMDGYFKYLHHPFEEEGVDFWWMDWQQGSKSKTEGVDPLRWLNHLHFYDLSRDNKRPFIFSRYSGYGSHRYPIGFSGDTVVTWESLKIQPWFTATAANVNFGWWSHDIGGHMGGVENPELYLRWLQWGVLSPIMRLHSSNSKFAIRVPWGHGPEVEIYAREAMQFRVCLIPYIYTMMYRNYTEDQPLIVPMYFDHPDKAEAYKMTDQYMFGTELLAAPFVTPKDPDLNMAVKDVWLPEGTWFDFFTAERYDGDKVLPVYGELKDIPLFAKAGAIVPLGEKQEWGGIENPSKLEVNVFPGADNAFTLYEDDGETTGYLNDDCAKTEFVLSYKDDEMLFTVNPVIGNRGLVPEKRGYTFVFKCVNADVNVSVKTDGEDAAFESFYSEKEDSLYIKGICLDAFSKLDIRLTASKVISVRDRRKQKLQRMLELLPVDSWTKNKLETLERGFTDDKDLQEVIDDPSILWSVAGEISGNQLRAMNEVVYGRKMTDI